MMGSNYELVVEEIRLRSLAERFGASLYVYSKRSIIDHCRSIERGLFVSVRESNRCDLHKQRS